MAGYSYLHYSIMFYLYDKRSIIAACCSRKQCSNFARTSKNFMFFFLGKQLCMQIEQEHVHQAAKGLIYVQRQSKTTGGIQRNPAVHDAAYDADRVQGIIEREFISGERTHSNIHYFASGGLPLGICFLRRVGSGLVKAGM